WQITSLATVNEGDAPFTTHRGILIAISGPISVSVNSEDALRLEQGKASVLAEGDTVLAVSETDAPVDLVVVELAAIADVAQGEAPDRVLPLDDLPQGDYRLVALNLPATPFGTPAPIATPK